MSLIIQKVGGDLALFHDYLTLAKAEKSISFLGRLGTYRYLNMDEVIAESLDFAAAFLRRLAGGEPPPAFPVHQGAQVA